MGVEHIPLKNLTREMVTEKIDWRIKEKCAIKILEISL